jgi:putative Holliday junction resolvase
MQAGMFDQDADRDACGAGFAPAGGQSRIMGLDVGEARIGVALSDPLGLTAQPLLVLERECEETDLHRLRELVEAHGVGAAVVGMPISLRGTEGPAQERMREFVRALADALPVPVVTWDERLSTVEAQRRMRAGGESQRSQRGVVDKVAAGIILQSYLDAHRNRRATEGS